MSTRFYLPSSGAAEVSPTYDPNSVWGTTGGNNHENGPLRLPLGSSKTGSGFASTSFSPDTADHITDDNSLFAQFIGPPMLPQTIAAQTVRLQMIASETNNGNNCFLTLELFICSRDGVTIKETILAITRDDGELANSLINRAFNATTSEATVEDGDRIVANIGIGGLPVATGGVQGHNGTLRLGDNDTVDLPENDTATADDNPWLEFANNILMPMPLIGQAQPSLRPLLISRLPTLAFVPVIVVPPPPPPPTPDLVQPTPAHFGPDIIVPSPASVGY